MPSPGDIIYEDARQRHVYLNERETRVEHKPGSPESNRVAVLAQIEQAMDRLETDAADKATWDGLTTARRQETSRLAVLLVAKLARLVIGKLDKA